MVHRVEIVELVEIAFHEAGPGRIQPGRIVLLSKNPISPFEPIARLGRTQRRFGHALPEQQPGFAAHGLRKRIDPLIQRSIPARHEQRRGFPEDQSGQGLPGFRFAVEHRSPVALPGFGQHVPCLFF
jgi:hypothetical protein